jgi:hypothetical protein
MQDTTNFRDRERGRRLGVVERDTTIEGGSETIIFDLKVPRHCPLVFLIGVRLEFRANSTFFIIYI